jgi:hypothetical protein
VNLRDISVSPGSQPEAWPTPRVEQANLLLPV